MRLTSFIHRHDEHTLLQHVCLPLLVDLWFSTLRSSTSGDPVGASLAGHCCQTWTSWRVQLIWLRRCQRYSVCLSDLSSKPALAGAERQTDPNKQPSLIARNLSVKLSCFAQHDDGGFQIILIKVSLNQKDSLSCQTRCPDTALLDTAIIVTVLEEPLFSLC